MAHKWLKLSNMVFQLKWTISKCWWLPSPYLLCRCIAHFSWNAMQLQCTMAIARSSLSICICKKKIQYICPLLCSPVQFVHSVWHRIISGSPSVDDQLCHTVWCSEMTHGCWTSSFFLHDMQQGQLLVKGHWKVMVHYKFYIHQGK